LFIPKRSFSEKSDFQEPYETEKREAGSGKQAGNMFERSEFCPPPRTVSEWT